MSDRPAPPDPRARQPQDQQSRIEVRFQQLLPLVPTAIEVPSWRELHRLGVASAQLWTAVADCLDSCDFTSAGAWGDRGPRWPSLSAVAWQDCLAAGYGALADFGSELHRRRMGPASLPPHELSQQAIDDLLAVTTEPRWDAWRALLELWTRVAYLGGRHGAGGLAARLAKRTVISPPQGESAAAVPFARWDPALIAALRELAQRACRLSRDIEASQLL